MTSATRIAPTRRRLMPEGVDTPLWSYATSDRLADEETAFFAEHPLCAVDLAWVETTLGPGPGLVADLGCGSGRAAARLANLGRDVLAIDLSRPMLSAMIRERQAANPDGNGSILPVQANLARLDFLPKGCLNAAVCLFSTLGMLPDIATRRRFLAGVADALAPGGHFLLHAHNWWVQKSTPQGRRWMAGDAIRRLAGSADFGNRVAHYRGIPNVRIHCFTWNEIARELAMAGFRIERVKNLDAATANDLGEGWLTRRIHAGGWLIEARKHAQAKTDLTVADTRHSQPTGHPDTPCKVDIVT